MAIVTYDEPAVMIYKAILKGFYYCKIYVLSLRVVVFFGGDERFHLMTDIWYGDTPAGVILREESIGVISWAVGPSLPCEKKSSNFLTKFGLVTISCPNLAKCFDWH